MYNLNDFCNIVSLLRREKGWTQAEFADRLGISPQSISKWECGVGFPDVTLFPAIAETLSVPIGVLFGEQIETEERMDMENKQNSQNKQSNRFESISIDQREAGYTEEFEVCDAISVRCGNVCRIEVIDGINESGKGHVRVVGDPFFLRYFSLEYITGQKEPDGLLINIKNPTGSAVSWKPYDRQGYTGENFIQIFTGASSPFSITSRSSFMDAILCNVCVYNYLDLNIVSGTNPQGNFEAVCYADGDSDKVHFDASDKVYFESCRNSQNKMKCISENKASTKIN